MLSCFSCGKDGFKSRIGLSVHSQRYCPGNRVNDLTKPMKLRMKQPAGIRKTMRLVMRRPVEVTGQCASKLYPKGGSGIKASS